jgi:hypothetical protein
MELVQGETLHERIKRASIPVHEALTITKQIAEALEAAHEKGIIHRDLKPGNGLEGDRKAKPFLEMPNSVQPHASFSPDGRWVAYMSTELGSTTPQLFVQPYPASGAKYQITTDGGVEPLWSPDGKQIFFTWTARCLRSTSERNRICRLENLHSFQFLPLYSRHPEFKLRHHARWQTVPHHPKRRFSRSWPDGCGLPDQCRHELVRRLEAARASSLIRFD